MPEQESTHTPGPWRFETEHYQYGGAEPMEWKQPTTLWTGWDAEKGRQLYTTAYFNSCGYSRQAAARSMADARLIAASPDMLKALEKTVARLGGLENAIATDDLEAYVTERREAQAALAQARGREVAT